MAEATVEYRTPLGTFSTWEEAAERCEGADLDPVTCIEILPKTLTPYDKAGWA